MTTTPGARWKAHRTLTQSGITVAVTRQTTAATGDVDFDPADYGPPAGPDTTVYEGPAAVAPSPTSADVDAAGAAVVVDTITLLLPPDVDFRPDDTVVLTAPSDPTINGRTARVEEVDRGVRVALRRVTVRTETAEVDA